MGGIVGRLFREFAVTLSVAIAISAVVSLTLTPSMASRLLQLRQGDEQGRIARAAQRAFERLLRGYDRSLQWVLDHHRLMLAVTLVTLGLSVWLYAVIPKGLFPQQDTGALSGFSEAPQDVSFATMKQRQEAVNAVVLSDRAVDHMVSFIGGNGPLNNGFMFVQLKPPGQRKRSADQVIADLRPSSRAWRESTFIYNRCRTCASAAAPRARNTSTRCRT